MHPALAFCRRSRLFAEAAAEAGFVFIGPPPHAIQAMGDKIESKLLAQEAGVSAVARPYDGAALTTPRTR